MVDLKMNSMHPPHIYKGILKSQLIRVSRLTTEENSFIEQLNKMKDEFVKSGYLLTDVNQVYDEVIQGRKSIYKPICGFTNTEHQDQITEGGENKIKDNVVRFVTSYNTNTIKVRKIIEKNWIILMAQREMRDILDISELGRSAKSYCEHTARTQPTLSDIVVSLVEMGFNVDTLPSYAKRSQRMVITAPPVTNPPVTPKALSAGQSKPHPAHIPSHFPEFPDPHSYIRTPTYPEPVSDYQILREKAASQRRDVERALTRFMAKTGETQSLFKDDITTFPLIAARPCAIPYLNALLPSELEMQQMEETDSSEQDDQTDVENMSFSLNVDDASADKENSDLHHSSSLSSSKNGEDNIIDNPYLRPVKKPKVRRKK
ncbi:transcription initiation factor TFIID subunit 8 [Protopterus annectens]|uniref:transcription initiation factor TFIID subunit 8 n=1 Tax=Protopterus annectens TaxID=7888 RepID=UPI001CFAC497|nr:transcription initiation factor TFIID subunit 8 [Protopterus annectens]